MRKVRRQSGIKAYLDRMGILQNGSEEEIRKAKKEYWKLYDTEYKRKKRRQKREYLISFTLNEIIAITATAKAKGLNIPEYIREATRADMKNAYVIPHPYLLKEVAQLLTWYKTSIKDIAENDKKNWLGITKNYESLEAIVVKIQSEILSKYAQAPNLILMIEETLQCNPNFITTLLTLIEKHHGGEKYDQKKQIMASAT